MINSRSINDLLPAVKRRVEAFERRCAEAGVPILIYSTYRDNESQAELHKIGRTIKGANVRPWRPMGDVVTMAGPGDSWHNWRCAADYVPLRYGKPVWGDKGADLVLWQKTGAIAESCGLAWAGRWKGDLQEMAHVQFTNSIPIADFKAGKVSMALFD